MDKEDVIYRYTHSGILLGHKKEQHFAFCSNMDGLGGHYDQLQTSFPAKIIGTQSVCLGKITTSWQCRRGGCSVNRFLGSALDPHWCFRWQRIMVSSKHWARPGAIAGQLSLLESVVKGRDSQV